MNYTMREKLNLWVRTNFQGNRLPQMAISHVGYLNLSDIDNPYLSESWQTKKGYLPDGTPPEKDCRYEEAEIEDKEYLNILWETLLKLQEINRLEDEIAKGRTRIRELRLELREPCQYLNKEIQNIRIKKRF